MDIFTQKKFLLRMVALLALLNILLIGVFLWKGYTHEPPEHQRPPRDNDEQQRPRKPARDVSQVLEKELDLSTDQAEKIKQLRQDFFTKEQVLGRVIGQTRDSMNLIMFNKNTDEAMVKSLAKKVADNEYQMELLRFEQAQKLKTICTPEQLAKFENLVIEIRDYFRPNDKPGRK